MMAEQSEFNAGKIALIGLFGTIMTTAAALTAIVLYFAMWARVEKSREREAAERIARRVEQIKALYGFDKPAPERFMQMLGQFARFDLGKSFFQNKSVAELIWEKMPVSISLGLWTFFISYLVAVPLGVAKAVRAGSRFDLVTTLLVLVGYAIPGFVLGVALLVGMARAFGDQLVLSGIQLPWMDEAIRMSPSIARASTVLIMALVLLWRPAGFFGKKE